MEIDITGLVENVRDITVFIKTFKTNYSKFSKKLKHNYARFKLLAFTIKYFLICGLLSAVIFSIMLLKNTDGMYIAVVLLLLWIPYFVFLVIFLPVWLLQQIYLIIKTFIFTIRKTFEK